MSTHESREPRREAPGPTPGTRDAQAEPNPRAGIEREVGDLEDPDAVEDEGALPGRVGGGLAGG